MKKIVFLLILGFNPDNASVYSQLTIDACQEKARANYPLVKQYGLIDQSESYSLSNANKGYLPQLSISAKATYQSEVIELPMNIPGFKGLSKDQYQAVAEVNQTVWDGGIVSSQKKITKGSSEVDRQKTEVDLYALKDRVNQLFFGALLLNEQLLQNSLLQKELQTNYERISAFVQSGIANLSDLDVVKVEQLKTKQRRAELIAVHKSFIEMLSAMIGDTINSDMILIKPEVQITADNTLINNRPEIKLFDAQSNLYASQVSVFKSMNMPKLSMFVQGGVGKPGLNMLKNEVSPFYIAGARLSWNFGGLYTYRNNVRKIEISKQSVDIQKNVFLYNSNLKLTQQRNEIEKINEQIKSDDEIITLRNNIKKTAEIKVENGTLSVTELIREINLENIAIQERSLHEIQLIIATYNIKNTINN